MKFAEKFGAKGAIIYDDPMSAAPHSAQDQDYIYPNGPFLPPTGVQRGSILSSSGDPLTPDYPSTGKNKICANKADI